MLVVLEKELGMTYGDGHFFPDDLHPNAGGNAIMAENISRFLVDSGLIVSPCGGYKS